MSSWDNAVWSPPTDPKALPSTPSAEDMQIVYAELAKQKAEAGSTYMDSGEMCALFGATDWDDDVMRKVRGLWHEGTPHAFPLVQTRLEQRPNVRSGVINAKLTSRMVAVCLRRDVYQWMENFLPAAEAAIQARRPSAANPLRKLIGK